MIINQESKKIFKLLNFTFIFYFSSILILTSLGILILPFNEFYKISISNKNLVLISMIIIILLQLVSKFIEYTLFNKNPIERRKIIILFFTFLTLVFLTLFLNTINIRNYEELILAFLIPISIVSISGILTYTNIAKVFYTYPPILFLLSATFLIATATILLHLPISSATGEPIALIDSLFIATSAVSCTGLSTVSIGKELSIVGQIILMATIQIGGLLIIVVSTAGIFFGLMSRNTIIKLRMASLFETKNIIEAQKLIVKFIIIAFSSQIIVAILIFPYFYNIEKNTLKALFYSIFHVISGLNNAGFSQYDDSLKKFINSPNFLILISFLILLGNTSIITVTELFDYIKTKIKNFINLLLNRKNFEKFSFSVFSKIIIITHITLITFGTICLLILESDNILKSSNYPLINAIFNSISFRTAGFTTIDFTKARDFTYIFFSILMFIGGGSISVAGGIKMNTIAIIILALVAFLKSYPGLYFKNKEIDIYNLIKANTVVISSIILLLSFSLILDEIIKEERFSKTIFELTSAFGTVGTSCGITNKNLPVQAKLTLITLMFLGKIGLITLLSSFAVKTPKYIGKLPKEKFPVG
ncbi:MAG: potassium transporter TrkG [Brevinematia bacterium]